MNIVTGTDNIDSLFDDIAELATSFDFNTSIEGKSLGLDCAGIAADSMLARAIDNQQAADGSPWDQLEEKYKAWKIKKYSVGLIGVRTGQMLSLRSFLGGLRISAELVEILYGTGEVPTDSKSSAFDEDSDGQISDIEKAFFFSGRRPFFELSDEDADKVFERIEHALEVHLTTF